MAIDFAKARDIFTAAVEKPDSSEQRSYLDEACGTDVELRLHLDRLLSAHVGSASFLDHGAVATLVAEIPLSEMPGTVIGPYTLLEQIGEGGFGVVFLAEQATPIRRRVALKIVKPGMDTRQVLARFEAERQALALMDHPSIAKVFDAGVTELGRSYFVMELVQGVPINQYCDQCNLPTRERLSLFIAVCQAVQHAHQKGIIHRDLKPTNVLVAMQDGRPVPKIIDFGIAKAIEQRLTEHTLTTGFAQMVGTPMYMSPEQAELSTLGVDTRTDIYSLGVLLYELLSGTTPFDRAQLHAASYDEMRRIIREEEPLRPSTRLTTLAAGEATTIAEHRRTDVRRLGQQVRGELDWVVMQCLEKDRNRRYDSAGSLARDVERYLQDEPVQACPPSPIYRLRKFIRRNRVGVLAGLAIAIAVVLGLVAASMGFIQARRQTHLARAEAARATQVQEFLQRMLASINPDTERGAAVTVQQVLARAASEIDPAFVDQPDVRVLLHETIGQTYYGLVLHAEAMPHLQKAVDLRKRYLPEEKLALADALLRLAQVCSWDPSKYAMALAMCRDALDIYKTQIPDSDERVIVARSLAAQFATPIVAAGQVSPDLWAARALPTVLGLSQDQIARLPPRWGSAIATAQRLNQAGDIAGARTALDQGHLALLAELRNLSSAGQIDDAQQLMRQAYSPWMEMPLLRTVMPIVLIGEAWEVRRDDKNLTVAEVILREAVAASREVWGQEHPYVARALTDLAIVLRQQGKLTEAERSAREALAIRRKLLGVEDRETITSAQCLIDVLTDKGMQSEADSLRREIGAPVDATQPVQLPPP